MRLHVPLSCDGAKLTLQEECIANYIGGTTEDGIETHDKADCVPIRVLFDNTEKVTEVQFSIVTPHVLHF